MTAMPNHAARYDVWPVTVSGGTASSAFLACGRCFYHLFLNSAGKWPGVDDPSCTLAELTARVRSHADECQGTL